MNIPVESIIVKFKFRKDLGDIESLKDSIAQHGLLNPIIINKKHELICGYRRLECVRELGWASVEVRILDVPDRISMINICLTENTDRKDFTVDEIIDVNKIQKKILNPNIFVKIWLSIKRFFSRFIPGQKNITK